MSQETRHKLSLEREEHLRQIEELNLERNSFIESGRKTRQETDLMRQEWDENRLTHERLRDQGDERFGVLHFFFNKTLNPFQINML